MRAPLALLVAGTCLLGTTATALQSAARRFDIALDGAKYPQLTAKECLASVLATIEARHVDYLLAHLADPAFVDKRVQAYAEGLKEQERFKKVNQPLRDRLVQEAAFAELVKETTAKLGEDPVAVKELRRFLKEGEWEGGDDAASARLKDVKSRGVFFRKIDNRWFFENRQRAEGK